MTMLQIIGTSPRRIGAEEKVQGLTLFGSDQGQPGDLYLAVVRAYEAPAKILRIDSGQAERMPAVVRVFTAADIPGINQIGIIPMTKDQPVLAEGVVRFPGEAVALVAAETQESALNAARAVVLELSPLPGVFDPLKALEPDAPLVHEKGNLLFRQGVVKGDAEEALSKSVYRLRRTYSTSSLEHGALELEGGRADWQDGRIVVYACTQNPHYDQGDLCRLLGLAPEKIRVVQTATGGGFGGKLDLSVQGYLALAVYHLKRSARLVYSREESFLSTSKRHPLLIEYESGMDESGKLTAVKVDILGDGGAYASYGVAVCMRAAVQATGPYEVPHVLVDSRMVYTHKHWCGAMRGFGVPQMALAHEGQMDSLALIIGVDPLEFRLRNCLKAGSQTATGQVLSASVGIERCLRRIQKIYQAWQKRAVSDPNVLRGVGLGAMIYGLGNTGVSNPSTAQIQVLPNGKLILFTGAAEIGQGSDTVLCQVTAQFFGIPMDLIQLVRGDTGRTTSSGATSASRQTYISGNAVLAAAQTVEDLLLHEAALEWHSDPHDLRREGPMIIAPDGRSMEIFKVAARFAVQGKELKGHGRFDPPVTRLDHKTGQGNPYASYAFAAQTALTEVDRHSGLVRVPRVAAAHDVGKAINRRGVFGQICGGIVMGIGFATMEEYIPGKTDNFREYHLPTMADVPRITPLLVEDEEPTGPYGAKGVGEPALIPTAPAVAGGVSNALGRPMTCLPLSLEEVMRAMEEKEKNDRRS